MALKNNDVRWRERAESGQVREARPRRSCNPQKASAERCLFVRDAVCLADAWATVRDNPTTRVAVVTGTCGNAFRSGADLGRLIALMSSACSRQSECGRRKGGDQVIRERGHFRASDTVKPGVAAFDGYAIALCVGLARRTNLQIGWQSAERAVGEIKAHNSTI